jgi:hypothetical protein
MLYVEPVQMAINDPVRGYRQVLNRRRLYVERMSTWFSDFDEDTPLSTSGLKAVVLNTGVAVPNNTAPTTVSRAVGLIDLQTGVNPAGALALVKGNQSLLMGFCECVFEARVAPSALPTGVEDFTLTIGWSDGGTALDGNDGVYFQFWRGLSTTNWNFVTAKASVNTKTLTTTNPLTAIGTAMQVLSIYVAPDASFAIGMIDGIVVATNTTNIPTGGAFATGLCCQIAKQAGATSRTLHVDYLMQRINYGIVDR